MLQERTPLDIILKLPSSALNSISCARGTTPDASIFWTASTIQRSIANSCTVFEQTHRLCSKALWPVKNDKISDGSASSTADIELIMKNISNFVKSVPPPPRIFGPTHDVRRRLDSAAFRSFTWAFSFARNCILSWSRRVYSRRSDYGWFQIIWCRIKRKIAPYRLAHVMDINEETIKHDNIQHIWSKVDMINTMYTTRWRYSLLIHDVRLGIIRAQPLE